MSREKAREIVKSAGYCQMATSVDGQPRVRPMKFVITDDFKFWCSTFTISGKVQEFQQNDKVELCWVDEHDPNLVHVEVIPTRVRWKEHSFGEYHEVE